MMKKNFFILLIFYLSLIVSYGFSVKKIIPKYFKTQLEYVDVIFDDKLAYNFDKTAFSIIDSFGRAQPIEVFKLTDNSVRVLPHKWLNGSYIFIVTSYLLKNDTGKSLDKDFTYEFDSFSEKNLDLEVKSIFPDVTKEQKPLIMGNIKFSRKVDNIKVYVIENGYLVNKNLNLKKINNTVIFRVKALHRKVKIIISKITNGGNHYLNSAYIFEYKVKQPDFSPPKLIFVSPRDGATDVPLNSQVFFKFDEKITLLPNAVIVYENDKRVKKVKTFVQNNIIRLNLRLKPSTSYKIILLKDKLKDLSNNFLTKNIVIQFWTRVKKEFKVLKVVPENGANISLKPVIMLFFSQKPNLMGIDKFIKLKGKKGFVDLKIDWVESLKALVIKPLYNLKPDSFYTFTIEKGLKNSYLNLSLKRQFKVSYHTKLLGDTTPPKILRVYPKNNQKVISDNLYIDVYFSELISNTVPKEVFEVYRGKEKVKGTILVFDTQIRFVVDDPKEGLYTVIVKPLVQDLSGNFLKQGKSWQFYFARKKKSLQVVYFSPSKGAVIWPNRLVIFKLNYDLPIDTVKQNVMVWVNSKQILPDIKKIAKATYKINLNNFYGTVDVAISSNLGQNKNLLFDGFAWKFRIRKLEDLKVVKVVPRLILDRDEILLEFNQKLREDIIGPFTFKLIDGGRIVKTNVFVNGKKVRIKVMEPVYSQVVVLYVNYLEAIHGEKLKKPLKLVFKNKLRQKVFPKLISWYPRGKVLWPQNLKLVFTNNPQSVEVYLNGNRINIKNSYGAVYEAIISNKVYEGVNLVLVKWYKQKKSDEFTFNFFAIPKLRMVSVAPKQYKLIPQYSKIFVYFNNLISTVESVILNDSNGERKIKNVSVSAKKVIFNLPYIEYGGTVEIYLRGVKDIYTQTTDVSKLIFNVISTPKIISYEPVSYVKNPKQIRIVFSGKPKNLRVYLNEKQIGGILWNNVYTCDKFKPVKGKNKVLVKWRDLLDKQKYSFLYTFYILDNLKLVKTIPNNGEQIDNNTAVILEFSQKLKKVNDIYLIFDDGKKRKLDYKIDGKTLSFMLNNLHGSVLNVQISGIVSIFNDKLDNISLTYYIGKPKWEKIVFISNKLLTGKVLIGGEKVKVNKQRSIVLPFVYGRYDFSSLVDDYDNSPDDLYVVKNLSEEKLLLESVTYKNDSIILTFNKNIRDEDVKLNDSNIKYSIKGNDLVIRRSKEIKKYEVMVGGRRVFYAEF